MLQVFDARADHERQLLTSLAEWCIRFTPVAAVDLPDGILLDASGCAHLWGGEQGYLRDIITRLRQFGYHVRAAIADTIGVAWAIARFGKSKAIIEPSAHIDALLPLPVAALRLEPLIAERLKKLGLHTISSFIKMPRRALRRRFGDHLLQRIDQATEQEAEILQPVIPIEPYHERLPSLEPIRTAGGIEIALRQLLTQLCNRLEQEGKGLRKSIFKCYRIDGNIQQIDIGTSRASRNEPHLFKLFELKIPAIEPALGIELFTIDAPVVEDIAIGQEALWNDTERQDNTAIAELLDTIAGRVGMQAIRRYLPAEHYWPERSFKVAESLTEQLTTTWRTDLPRPIHLLPVPEKIEVSVMLPDYPPMLFIYNGVLHNVRKADGPERIEQEWWITNGDYRDYYCVEDEQGARYWVFRLGDYSTGEPSWFIHGFFA